MMVSVLPCGSKKKSVTSIEFAYCNQSPPETVCINNKCLAAANEILKGDSSLKHTIENYFDERRKVGHSSLQFLDMITIISSP